MTTINYDFGPYAVTVGTNYIELPDLPVDGVQSIWLSGYILNADPGITGDPILYAEFDGDDRMLWQENQSNNRNISIKANPAAYDGRLFLGITGVANATTINLMASLTYGA